MEPQQPQSPPGWHRDPWGRFEYRYFNGVQWTTDVAINGQRYVDAPAQQYAVPQAATGPSQGLAITSFVTALVGVVIGWIPFVFVGGVAAAVTAIVFGILGLGAARRHNGHGRGFAVAGLVLAPLALAACVGGFLLTRTVVRELGDLIDTGPYDLLDDQPCSFENGVITYTGTIRNLDDHSHTYRILMDITVDGSDITDSVATVGNVRPKQVKPWSFTASASGERAQCAVVDVLGPLPFDPQS